MPGFPEVGLQAVLEGTSQFEKDAASVSGSVTTLGSTVLKTAGVMGGVALGAVGALGAGFVGLAGSALGPIGDFERMSASLSSLVAREVQAGDATLSFDEALAAAGPKTKDLIGWVEQLAIISPFESKDVAASMQMAMSFGLNTERAKELTSAEINWAAATGKGGEQMQRVSFALGKMNTQGKLNGEILMQLAEAGVPANKILQEMGYTAEDASKGLVPVDKFMSAVIADFNKFGSAAQAQANTWPGLISSLEDLKNIALREFFTKTFEAIKPYVVEFVTMLQDPGVRKWLSEVGTMLGDFVGKGLATVVSWLKEAKAYIEPVIALVSALFQGFVTPEEVAWDDLFPEELKGTVIWIQEHFDLIKGAIEGIGAVLAGAAIATAIAGIAGAVLALANPITALIAAGALLGAAWETNWMGMRDTLTAFWNDTAKPALTELYDWFQEQLPIAMQKLTDFWKTTLLPALKDLADWLKVNVPKAAEAVVKFWKEELVPGVEKLSGWINKTGIPALKDLEKWINTKLIPAVQDFAKWINTKLIPALTDLKPIFDDVLQSLRDLKPALDKAGDALSGASKKMDKGGFDIRQIITTTFDYVADYIKKKLQIAQDTIGIFSDVISGDWKSAWERIQNLTTNILDTITLGITAKMREIGEGIGKSLADVVSDWGSKWDQLRTTAGQKAQAVVDTVINYISKLPGEVSKFVGQMVTAGANLIGGVITGISNKAGDLLNQISTTVSNSVSSLVNSIKSGSIFGQLTSAGSSLISGIVSGISAAASFGSQLISKAASAVSELVSSIASGGLYSILIATGQTIITLIGAGVTAATNFATQLISKIGEAISGAVKAIASGDLFNRLYGVGQGMVNGIIDGMNAQVDAIEQAFGNIIQAAVDAAKARLGIACPDPSPVTAELGVGMVEGLKLGMLSKIPSLIPALEASMAGLVLAPALVAGPGLGGGGGGNTTINNFHVGGNNITSGMDQAVFEARVLQVIRRNLR